MAFAFRGKWELDLLFVASLCFLVSTIVYFNFVLDRGPMRWDEGEHAFTGLVFANDITSLNLPLLLEHCHEQLLWPFMQPLLLSQFFIVFGASITAGRVFTLIFYFLFSVSLFFLGREMTGKDRNIAGILTSGFGLVVEALFLAASEIMLEMMALFFFTMAVLFFLRFLGDKKHLHLVTVFSIFTFFTRTNYGIVLIMSVIAHFIVRDMFRPARIMKNRDLWKFALPVLIVIMLWLLPPDRLFTFLGFLINRPEGPPPLSIEGLMTYPYELLYYSGAIILLFAASFVASARFLRNEKIRYLFILVVLTLALNFFHQNKKIRYILYIYPPLFCMASFHMTRLFTRIRSRNKHAVFFGIFTVIMLLFSFHMLNDVRVYGDFYDADSPVEFIAANTGDMKNIFILGEFNELNPGMIAWSVSNIGDIKEIKYSSAFTSELMNSNIGFEIPSVEPDINVVNEFVGKYRFDGFVLVDFNTSSYYYNTEDYQRYNKWKLGYLPLFINQTGYTQVNSSYFDSLGINVTIMRKISS